MRLASIVVVVCAAGDALAQPGAPQPAPAPGPYVPPPGTAPAPYPPPPGTAPAPAPYPPPAPYAQPAPYGQAGPYGQPPPYAQPAPYGQPAPYPQPALTADEVALLSEGEISDGQIYGGFALNFFFGLGVGQAVQGRYMETGWIFTLGEVGFGFLMFDGLLEAFSCDFNENCSNKGTGKLVIGLLGYGAVHIWSLVDAITGPQSHNRHVRALRARTGYGWSPYVTRVHGSNDGMVGGLALRF